MKSSELRKTILLLLFPLLFVMQTAEAAQETCSHLQSFSRANFERKSKKTKIEILPFVIKELPAKGKRKKQPPKKMNSPEWVVPVVLQKYLSLNEKLIPQLVMKKTSSEAVQVSGVITPSGKGFHVVTQLIQENMSPIKIEGNFDFPQTLNEFLVALTEKISEVLLASIDQKDILPFLHRSSSATAHLQYALGKKALLAPTHESLLEAQKNFEAAISADYNDVPSYLGLSETFAGLAAWERVHHQKTTSSWAQRAQTTLLKAQLLNPPLSKKEEKSILWYLKESPKEICRGNP